MSAVTRLITAGMFFLILGKVSCKATYTPRPDIGLPGGLIPQCPGIMKNATISPKMMSKLQIVYHRLDENGQPLRRSWPVMVTARSLAKDKHIDFKRKKTVLYACGFFDSEVFTTTQAVAVTLAKRGYNVLVTETFSFLTHIYPISVRLARTIGGKIGDMLIKLMAQGLRPEDLELVGISLGAHIAGYAAKRVYEVTGQKVSRITGLDPAGPCFRSLPPANRLSVDDAHQVDIIHTNIDGFGIAEPIGHVDFYANGGEFQPGDILYFPCLVICSHLRALIYYWQALEHPKKFLAVKCDSVQDARLARCYNNTQTNYFGIETKFNRPGIYYLPTNNVFPYYRGKDGLKSENEVYTSNVRMVNQEDNFVV